MTQGEPRATVRAIHQCRSDRRSDTYLVWEDYTNVHLNLWWDCGISRPRGQAQPLQAPVTLPLALHCRWGMKKARNLRKACVSRVSKNRNWATAEEDHWCMGPARHIPGWQPSERSCFTMTAPNSKLPGNMRLNRLLCAWGKCCWCQKPKMIC